MTKKHFIALAQHIKRAPYSVGFSAAHLEVLADFCQSQNPRFNRGLWLAYIRGECGPNGRKVAPDARA
jgi:hypothetical protein